MFEQLRAEHQLDARYETILYIGALLHEIGLFIAQRSYHKHSMYVIRNSEIFGLGRKDLLMASLIARYHRRASPQPTHEGYSTLDRDERGVRGRRRRPDRRGPSARARLQRPHR